MTPLDLALALLRLPKDQLNEELVITRFGSKRRLEVRSVSVSIPENWNSTRHPRIFLDWHIDEKP